MYTAIGFSIEHEGFCDSMGVMSEDPQTVASSLFARFGIWFEQILLMKNATGGPEVVHHWNLDQDFFSL